MSLNKYLFAFSADLKIIDHYQCSDIYDKESLGYSIWTSKRKFNGVQNRRILQSEKVPHFFDLVQTWLFRFVKAVN